MRGPLDPTDRPSDQEVIETWRERAARCLAMAEAAQDPDMRKQLVVDGHRYLKVAVRLEELDGYLRRALTCQQGPPTQPGGFGVGVAAADADVLQRAVVEFRPRAALVGAVVGGGEPAQYCKHQAPDRREPRCGAIEVNVAGHHDSPWFELPLNLGAQRRFVVSDRFVRARSVRRRFVSRRNVGACPRGRTARIIGA
jgi:hypothetical protein